jgi:hypothetical protein
MTNMNESKTVHASLEAANEALGRCPAPLAGSGGYHWWYVDGDEERKHIGADGFSTVDYVACMCKTCGLKMRLSSDADEYPAV